MSVMIFACSGLLGVYFTILFTRRGSSASVIWALGTGFVAIARQQSYVVDVLALPASWKSLAFPYSFASARPWPSPLASSVTSTRRKSASG